MKDGGSGVGGWFGVVGKGDTVAARDFSFGGGTWGGDGVGEAFNINMGCKHSKSSFLFLRKLVPTGSSGIAQDGEGIVLGCFGK